MPTAALRAPRSRNTRAANRSRAGVHTEVYTARYVVAPNPRMPMASQLCSTGAKKYVEMTFATMKHARNASGFPSRGRDRRSVNRSARMANGTHTAWAARNVAPATSTPQAFPTDEATKAENSTGQGRKARMAIPASPAATSGSSAPAAPPPAAATPTGRMAVFPEVLRLVDSAGRPTRGAGGSSVVAGFMEWRGSNGACSERACRTIGGFVHDHRRNRPNDAHAHRRA